MEPLIIIVALGLLVFLATQYFDQIKSWYYKFLGDPKPKGPTVQGTSYDPDAAADYATDEELFAEGLAANKSMVPLTATPIGYALPPKPSDEKNVIKRLRSDAMSIGASETKKMHVNLPDRVMVYLPDSRAILVLGQAGCGKTTGLLIPIICYASADRGLLCSSVKTDLLVTIPYRLKVAAKTQDAYGNDNGAPGEVKIFDPAHQLEVTDYHKYTAPWTPLQHCSSYPDAQFLADQMVFATQNTAPNGDSFWTEKAALLLAPLMYYVRTRPATFTDPKTNQPVKNGKTMRDVRLALASLEQGDNNHKDKTGPIYDLLHHLEEIIRQTEIEVAGLERMAPTGPLPRRSLYDSLEDQPKPRNDPARLHELKNKVYHTISAVDTLNEFVAQLQAGEATFSSVTQTLQLVFKPWSATDYRIGEVAYDDPNLIDPAKLMADGKSSIYLCSTQDDAKLFAAITRPFIEWICKRTIPRLANANQTDQGGQLVNPIMVVLDEIANSKIVSSATLGLMVSTFRSYRAQVILASQDLSQMEGEFGQLQTGSLYSNTGALIAMAVRDVHTREVLKSVFGTRLVKDVSTSTSPRSVSVTKTKTGDKSHSETESQEVTSVTRSFREKPLLADAAALRTHQAFAMIGPRRTPLLTVPWFQDPIAKQLMDPADPMIYPPNDRVGIVADSVGENIEA